MYGNSKYVFVRVCLLRSRRRASMKFFRVVFFIYLRILVYDFYVKICEICACVLWATDLRRVTISRVGKQNFLALLRSVDIAMPEQFCFMAPNKVIIEFDCHKWWEFMAHCCAMFVKSYEPLKWKINFEYIDVCMIWQIYSLIYFFQIKQCITILQVKLRPCGKCK